jgi:hypothetical protein
VCPLMETNPRLLPSSDCWATREARRDGRDRSICGYQRRVAPRAPAACPRNSPDARQRGRRLAQIVHCFFAHRRHGPQAQRPAPEHGASGCALPADQPGGTDSGQQLSGRCVATVAEHAVDAVGGYARATRDESEEIPAARSQSRATARNWRNSLAISLACSMHCVSIRRYMRPVARTSASYGGRTHRHRSYTARRGTRPTRRY